MKNRNKILIALGAGLAIGGILGVLFAPKKGKETRDKLAGEGKKLAEDLKDKFNKGREMASDLKSDILKGIAEN